MDKFDAFVKRLEELCIKHDVELSALGFNCLEVGDLTSDDPLAGVVIIDLTKGVS